MTQPLQPNLKNLPLAPAQCISHTLMSDKVASIISQVSTEYSTDSVLSNFLIKYRSWILSSNLNTVTGLDNFDVVCYSNGTTESFDHFYLRHSTKRFRCFKGEYLYHRLVWDSSLNYNWKFLEDDCLKINDAVVISLPFADTGNQHHLYNKDFLDECFALNIPVLLDCAFFGICQNIDFDFTHPAITDVCFSLSKTFPVNNIRIGIRFTRNNYFDGLSVYQNAGYVNLLGAAVGLKLLEEFNPDYTVINYKNKQLELCNYFKLTPSLSVIFGLDSEQRYNNYNRGMPNNNRICFSKYFNSTDHPVI